MINILYVVSTLKRCGPTNQLSYIIKYLDKTKFTPIILTLSPEPIDSMRELFEGDLNVRVSSLGLSRFKSLFFARAALKRFIDANNIGLIHSQGIRADSLASKLDIPTVATLRNYPYYDYPMTYGHTKGWLMAKIHLGNLKKINSPVVVSKSVSNMLLRINNYKIGFIQNGVDLDRFPVLSKSDIRNNLGIPLHSRVFISVGHLNSRKDPITIIKAFNAANIENSRLIFLGEGELLEQCNSLADERVSFLGKVNNVTDYLAASDYFVSASLAEGLPNTVLEAMAARLPCILSNIPPHVELADLFKYPPLLFDTGNVIELQERISQSLTLDNAHYGLASRHVIEEHLNAKIMSEKYQVKYAELHSIVD